MEHLVLGQVIVLQNGVRMLQEMLWEQLMDLLL